MLGPEAKESLADDDQQEQAQMSMEDYARAEEMAASERNNQANQTSGEQDESQGQYQEQQGQDPQYQDQQQASQYEEQPQQDQEYQNSLTRNSNIRIRRRGRARTTAICAAGCELR